MTFIYSVSDPIDGLKSCVDKLKLESRYMDYGGHTLYTCLTTLMETLGRGLGPRIKLLQLEQHTTPSVSLVNMAFKMFKVCISRFFQQTGKQN